MFGLGVCAAVEEEPDAQGRLGGRVGGLDEHLPAHPEMGQDSVARVEREPEILAAAVCGADRAAGEGRDEAGRTAGVTAYRAGVQDLDVADRGAEIGRASCRERVGE